VLTKKSTQTGGKTRRLVIFTVMLLKLNGALWQ